MKCKAFDVGIELEVQAVTCPGVWLCPNGQITVQIYLLGLCSQTSTMSPIFPLLCHEKFTFHKNFSNLSNLFELDHKLSKELVYMELIQWENCDNGNVLATFKTSLTELLYPFPKRKGMIAGVDVDLLMEATRKFPGIIAPKIEISTKMTIKEVLCSVKKDKKNDVVVVNPKLISSKCIPKRKVPLHQKKVCHSHRYYNTKQTKNSHKNNFMEYKDNLLDFDDHDYLSPRTSKKIKARKVSNGFYDEDSLDKDFVNQKIQQIRNSSSDMQCRCEETKVRCPLCEKYKCVFTEPCSCKNQKTHSRLSRKSKEIKESTVDERSEKRNSRESPYQHSPRLELQTHTHSQNSTDINKDINGRYEKEYNSSTRLSLDTKDTLVDDETCTDKFYKNLEQFYKQLYMRAHYKLKNEKCKCRK